MSIALRLKDRLVRMAAMHEIVPDPMDLVAQLEWNALDPEFSSFLKDMGIGRRAWLQMPELKKSQLKESFHGTTWID